MPKTLRLATRRSALARAQTEHVTRLLEAQHPALQVEAHCLSTQGDRVTDRPLRELGGKGLFIKEIEAAVLRREADVAVHSLKDVPGDEAPHPDLHMGCFPERRSSADLLISKDGVGIAALPAGARIGTGSLRRICQLRRRRPDLRFVGLRGNVETRLRSIDVGRVDAVVLAEAGLDRLGLDVAERAHRLEPSDLLPAVGQGTLALVWRHDSQGVADLVMPLEAPAVHCVTAAERSFLATLQGNCHTPIAGLARLDPGEGRLAMQGMVASPDGRVVLEAAGELYLPGVGASFAEAKAASRAELYAQARELGAKVASDLLASGAKKILDQAESQHWTRQLFTN